MRCIKLYPITTPINRIITVPADKSISHRAVILGSLAHGTTNIHNFLPSNDCLKTVNAFKELGVHIEQDHSTSLTIKSKGRASLIEPKQSLDVGNSGTTARLLLGVLAGARFHTTMYGDQYLTKRPMERVTTPLRNMGASIDGRENGKYLPLSIRGGNLQGIKYQLPVKSAQVKSAILLAGLFAEGETTVIEQTKTRDHTENMLQAFGAKLAIEDQRITLKSNQLHGISLSIPGDISSASFFLVAAAIVPDSQLTIKEVGLNETRTGVIDVLLNMGAKINITNQKKLYGEPVGDITISYHKLRGTVIKGEMIPRLIDEIPVLALLATQAEGKTVIQDAEELRLKETDRIRATVTTLKTLGANITECDDGMLINGKTTLLGGEVSSFYDHRIAMMIAVASLITKDHVTIDETDSIAISYPNFFTHFTHLTS